MKGEPRHAVLSMKNGKAVGPDQISAEVIKALDEVGIDVLCEMLNEIYNTGIIPQEMSKSIFVELPTTSGATECGDFRTVSLLSHIFEILLKIIMLRMRSKINAEVSNHQYGFMENKGTRNANFLLRLIAERAAQVHQDLFLYFIDYKAFGRVDHSKLMEPLDLINTDDKDTRIIQELYYEQIAAVRVRNEITEWTKIETGVRQRCVLSPDL